MKMGGNDEEREGERDFETMYFKYFVIMECEEEWNEERERVREGEIIECAK